MKRRKRDSRYHAVAVRASEPRDVTVAARWSMYFRNASRALFLVLMLAMVRCASGPSFESYFARLLDYAGPNAMNCGVVTLKESRSSVVTCGQQALASHTPFVAIFQVRGIDSEIFTGVAVKASGEAVRLRWDSDATGGSGFAPARRIFEEDCPALLLSDSMQPIECMRRDPAARPATTNPLQPSGTTRRRGGATVSARYSGR